MTPEKDHLKDWLKDCVYTVSRQNNNFIWLQVRSIGKQRNCAVEASFFQCRHLPIGTVLNLSKKLWPVKKPAPLLDGNVTKIKN